MPTVLTYSEAIAAELICPCGDRLVNDRADIPARNDGSRRGVCGCFRARRRQKPVAR